MQVHFTIKKIFFLISFYMVVQLILMNCYFDSYDLKIHFVKCI